MSFQIGARTFRTADCWFPDGNVVLLVRDVAFKVHRGQLARHSDVFRDMFALPPPPRCVESIDGCPWVELHDDPADVLHLLRALYDGLYFRAPGAGNFPALAAVLRLSSKYFIEHLHERCAARLAVDWPSTLAGWDAREARATQGQRYGPREHYAHPVHVVRLAAELRLEGILPAALYDLSRYGPRKIAAGTPPIPPCPFFMAANGEARTAGNEEEEQPVRLVDTDLHATFAGREAGQRFLAAFIERELSGRPASAGCANRAANATAHCRESFYFIMLNLLRAVSGIATGRDADPLFSLAQAAEMLGRTDFSDGTRQCGLRICAACREDFAGAVARARAEAWEMVPVWFGLKPAPLREGLDSHELPPRKRVRRWVQA